MIKIRNKLGIKRKHFNTTKPIYETHRVNIGFNGGRLKTFPLI
jgi:hypothetical protein